MKKNTRISLYIGIIILVLLLGGISFYQRSVGEPYVARTAEDPERPNDDIDGDGLKNWEEVLWKTKANNPDTDGDGTNDGLEVALGRDPIVAGPNDYIEGILYSGSYTSDVASNFLTSYLSAATEGEGIEGLGNEILEKTFIEGIKKPFAITYTESDLKLRGNSTEDFKEYGNQLVLLFSYFEDAPDELSIALTAIQTNDPEDLRDLDIVVENYKMFLSGLLNTRTPQEIQSDHLALINSVSVLLSDINGMKLLLDDAILGTQSIADYQIDAPVVQNSLVSIIEKIIESGAEYSTDEIGYVLVNIL